MFEVYLQLPEDGSPSPHLAVVVKETERLETQKVKIFRIYCRVGEIQCILTTTSKDIYLGLGMFSSEAQNSLCILLEENFHEQGCDELLLFRDKEKKRGGMLVSRSVLADSCLKYTLSPAH